MPPLRLKLKDSLRDSMILLLVTLVEVLVIFR